MLGPIQELKRVSKPQFEISDFTKKTLINWRNALCMLLNSRSWMVSPSCYKYRKMAKKFLPKLAGRGVSIACPHKIGSGRGWKLALKWNRAQNVLPQNFCVFVGQAENIVHFLLKNRHYVNLQNLRWICKHLWLGVGLGMSQFSKCIIVFG